MTLLRRSLDSTLSASMRRRMKGSPQIPISMETSSRCRNSVLGIAHPRPLRCAATVGCAAGFSYHSTLRLSTSAACSGRSACSVVGSLRAVWQLRFRAHRLTADCGVPLTTGLSAVRVHTPARSPLTKPRTHPQVSRWHSRIATGTSLWLQRRHNRFATHNRHAPVLHFARLRYDTPLNHATCASALLKIATPRTSYLTQCPTTLYIYLPCGFTHKKDSRRTGIGLVR